MQTTITLSRRIRFIRGKKQNRIIVNGTATNLTATVVMERAIFKRFTCSSAIPRASRV